MSDSSCSNCERNDDCKFVDQSYNCYVKEVMDIQKNLDDLNIDLLKITLRQSKIHYNTTGDDDFNQLIYYLNIIITKYEEIV